MAVTTLSVFYFGLMAFGGLSMASEAPRTPEPERAEVRACIDRHLPNLSSGNEAQRLGHLVSLDGELRGLGNRKIRPNTHSRKQLARELLRLYRETQGITTEARQIRERLAEMLTAYGDDELARPALLSILDDGSEGERGRVLATLGLPGAVSGSEFFSKVDNLVRRGKLKESRRTTYLARIDKERALPEILETIRVSSDKETVLYSAWALQNYYKRPADYAVILRRVKDLGLDKAYDSRGNGLFWIDVELLYRFISEAAGDDLRLALGIVVQDSGLCAPVGIPVLVGKLAHADQEVRILAARALALAGEHGQADRKSIGDKLRKALLVEQIDVVRRAVEDAIRRIDDTERDLQELKKRFRRE